MPVIGATYLKLLDASIAASSEANKLCVLKRVVILWSRVLDRSADNAGHAEDELSSRSSSPESHTAELATLND